MSPRANIYWRYGDSYDAATLHWVCIVPRVLPEGGLIVRKPNGQPVGVFELSSLAVDNGYQGQGIGKKLVDFFYQSAIREGAKGVCLLTDETDNKIVKNFYANLGFKKVTTFMQSKAREMAVLVKTKKI